MGITENNSKMADLNGIEYKSKRRGSSAHVTLLTRNPTTPDRAVHVLLEEYGRLDAKTDIKRFNTNLAVGRHTQFGVHHLTVQATKSAVQIVRDDGAVQCEWELAFLEEAMKCKLSTLALTEASTRIVSGVEEYRYETCCMYDGFSMDRFIALLNTGAISIHFRVKGRLNAARNRGTAFKISKVNLRNLYADVSVVF